jgi:hypothetical protein
MKNYSKENYSNYADFEKALVDECVMAFIPHKATYRDRTVNIVSFTFGDVNFGAETKRVLKVMVELEPNNIAMLVFNLAVNSGTLKLNEEDNVKYQNIKLIVDEALDIHEQELKEEARLRDIAIKKAREERAAELARRVQIAEEQAKELKIKKKIEKQLAKLETLKPENTSKLFDAPQSQYEILGWMAKHCTSVRAAMPDYMEKWFVGKFGDVERYVVNSKKKTSGGFDYQWGLGLKITFNSEVSGPLEQRTTSKNKKVIDSVAFVWDLIENYGFQFGKVQNISQIKQEIPAQYLNDFEKGYAM